MRVRVASAGTGKTTSLVRRYLELIDSGVPLRRIAGVTFTRASAAELRTRVAQGIGEVLDAGSYLGGLFVPGCGEEPFARAADEVGGAVLKTIHGFMIAGLRLSAPLLGLDPRFAMVTEPEARADFADELRSVVALAMEPSHHLNWAVTAAGRPGMRLVASVFERRSLAPDLTFSDAGIGAAVGALYSAAYDRLRSRYAGRTMGPGEVERAALRALEHPEARARLVARFPIVLVDEYQDVNPLQGAFFEELERAGATLEVVGDPKQSIYLFRNADVRVFRRALAAASRTGDVLEPLTESRRHSQAVVALLNRYTTVAGRAASGFSSEEAPPVIAAGAQADVGGSAEVAVVSGEGGLEALRAVERSYLAASLIAARHDRGVPYDRMAVLARSHRQLAQVAGALERAGVPTDHARRGLYLRQEMLDVRYALELGATRRRRALAAVLRGPLCRMPFADLKDVLDEDDPFAALERSHPSAAAVVEELERVALAPPLEALATVLRGSVAGRAPLVSTMAPRARANVDTLLFEVASRRPADVERLLALLTKLSVATDEEEVPAGGDGVRLLTVHASKGLEFDLVALYDASYIPAPRPPDVVVEAGTGRVSLPAAASDPETASDWAARSADESARLLYVALSRARDHLLVTGSVNGAPRGWMPALLGLSLEEDPPHPAVAVKRLGPAGVPAPEPAERMVSAAPPVEPSGWEAVRFEPPRHGPLSSPSRLVGLTASGMDPSGAEEPLTPSEVLPEEDQSDLAAADGDAAALLGAGVGPPGRGRVVGTLVHFAISQDWLPGDARLASLGSHEVMFPYDPTQRDELLAEVDELLAGYASLLGPALPVLTAREVDRAELPLAYPGGPTVWEGVIDRLYRADGEWWIDDYKTDRRVAPERYMVQLGLYREAVQQALGVTANARLVFLRTGVVVPLDPGDLARALDASGIR